MSSLLTIVVIAVAVTLAALAIGPRRHWLVLPPVAVVAAALVLPLATAFTVERPWPSTVVALGLGALGVLAGNPIATIVLRYAQGGVELGDNGGIVIDDTGAISKRREILRGGSTIGYLERAALIGAVIAGQAAAAALIVAVKGLGRFSELDDSMARERFIIGTLTSLIWAGACAAAIMLVV